jgi:hypothetical protein
MDASSVEELDAIAKNLTEENDADMIYILNFRRRDLIKRERLLLLNDRLSLVAALSYGEKLKVVTYRGLRGTSEHARAESTPSEFPITKVTQDLEIISTTTAVEETVSFMERLRGTSLQGHFETKGSLLVSNEAEVQTVVYDVLRDAVSICNIMLGLNEATDICLIVRRKANLFTNKPDHSAVYLFSDLKTPIVTIQDIPGKDAVADQRVHGQKFDQLLEIVLRTYSGNAIGAVTSIEETRIAWIGDRAHKIVQDGNFLSMEKLRACKARLSNTTSRTDTDPSTPLPQKQKEYPAVETEGIQMIAETNTLPRNAKKRRIEPQRKLFLSQAIQAENLLHAFCNLILAGILIQPVNPVVTLPRSQSSKLSIPSCVVLQDNGEAPGIDCLDTRIHGPVQKPKLPALIGRVGRTIGVLSSSKFFLIEWLSSGLIYNVFRVLTPTGYECVLKMYVREYDYNGKKIAAFDTNGRKAITQEENMYKKVYPELEPYVWTLKLCGRYCLILPFFEEVPQDKRRSSVDQIFDRYQQCFVSKQYHIPKEKIRWRHIGMFENKLFIYSLDDLQFHRDMDNETDVRQILLESLDSSTGEDEE